MKKLSFLLLLLPLITHPLAGFFECCPQIYIAGSGGLSFHGDTETKTKDASHDVGFVGTASIGYILERWRMELEGSFRRYSNDKVAINNAATNNSGHVKEKALLFNVLYDIPLAWQCVCPLSVYIGSGLGISRSEFAVEGSCDFANVFAWQVMTGVSMDLTQYWAVTLGYRFFSTAKPTYNNEKVCEIPYSNNIDLGLRLTF